MHGWDDLETMVDRMRTLAHAQRTSSPDRFVISVTPQCTLIFTRSVDTLRLAVENPVVGLDVAVTGPKQFRTMVGMAIRMCQMASSLPATEASIPDLPTLIAQHGSAIRDAYQRMSLSGLADHFDVPVARMRSVLIALDVPIRPAGHRPLRGPSVPTHREADVLARFDRQEPLEAIATASGYSRENIRLIARKFGRRNRRDVAREAHAQLRERVATAMPASGSVRDVARAVSRPSTDVLPIITSIDPAWIAHRQAEGRRQRQTQASAIAIRARLAIEVRNSSVGLVAEGMQVPASVISQLLSGARQSGAVLSRFAACLEIPLPWLLQGHPVPPDLADADLQRLEAERIAMASRVRLAIDADPRRVDAIAAVGSWPVGRLRAILGQVASPRPYVDALARMLDVPRDWLAGGQGQIDWVARRTRLVRDFPDGLRSTVAAGDVAFATDAMPSILDRLRIWCYGYFGTLSRAATVSGLFPRRFAALLNGRVRDDVALRQALDHLHAPRTWIETGLPESDEHALAPIIERGQQLLAQATISGSAGSDPPATCLRRFYIMLAAHQLTPTAAALQAQVDARRLQRVLHQPRPTDMHLLTQIARSCGVPALWIRRGRPDGDLLPALHQAAAQRGVDLAAFIAWIDQPEPVHATA